jgi:hypothetical protein
MSIPPPLLGRRKTGERELGARAEKAAERFRGARNLEAVVENGADLRYAGVVPANGLTGNRNSKSQALTGRTLVLFYGSLPIRIYSSS